jgi:hypothetical protein
MDVAAAFCAAASRTLVIVAACAFASACGPPGGGAPGPGAPPILDYANGHGEVKVSADDGTGAKDDHAEGPANAGAGNTVTKKVTKGASDSEGTVSLWNSIVADFTLSRGATANHSPKASSDNTGTSDVALKGNQDRKLTGDLTTKITAHIHNARTAQVSVSFKVETAAGGAVYGPVTETYTLSENAADNTKLDIKDHAGAVKTVDQATTVDMPGVPLSFTLAHATPGPAKFKFTYILKTAGEVEVASDLKAEGHVVLK